MARPVWRRLFGRCPLADHARAAYGAADRHVDLARRLTDLPDAWTVFEAPSIPLGPIAADFVAVGPAGIIVLGSATAVSEPPTEAASARATGFRTAVSRALETDVPVLTFHVGRASAPARNDIAAVRAREVVETITALPDALAPAQVAALSRLVNDTFDPSARTTPAERDTFLALSDDVSRAERTRVRWWAALAVLAGVAIAVGIAAVL